ncbi:protein kinase domain protein [Gregarina niphandrodes]|uniref:Protein kinase domain protein n=1 Tax=Gregarina niphandrodes TaxID=110365 RepID=A0A023B2F7_GRENI|nr:protein kinase domain protein [Gregarina niphandrodes]EZG53808.1 protein kinase domain protein [Gregarina niphandrodes]|eukprot:XP_011131859.1 protein kinase domain protein [Gregarina niphandrodes]
MERVCSTTRTYEIRRQLGNGSFGVVSEAVCIETGETVAIKKVLQDPRYKNRELDVMKQLLHPNIVSLKDYFYTEGPNDTSTTSVQRFLSVVMEYVPETVYRALKEYTRMHTHLPIPLVQIYGYQMIRSLGYLHSLGICHRDIKPQNLLVDSKTHVVKLCDFGSAKRLYPGETSVSYICSRFYRAPELMLGSTEYTCAIDTWSTGCVLAEMLIGRPLFAGDTSVNQLVKIIQVLGAPTPEQTRAMNPQYGEFSFPSFVAKSWKSVIPSQNGRIPEEVYDLLSEMLKYEPEKRIDPYAALAHPFFDDLRKESFRLPSGAAIPPLFDFSSHELKQMTAEIRIKCLPEWIRQKAL